MASVQDALTSGMKDAMRARESDRLTTIRFVLAALKYAQIEAMHPLTDEQEIAVLRKQAKMRRDSIEQFTKAERTDLADKETAELAVIEGYLPAALGPEQVREAVRAAIAETGASGMKEMSAVMRVAMARLGAQADGRVVQGIVREELTARG